MNVTVHIVMNPSEKKLVRQASALKDCSMSAFGRKIILDEAKKILKESLFFAHNDPIKRQI